MRSIAVMKNMGVVLLMLFSLPGVAQITPPLPKEDIDLTDLNIHVDSNIVHRPATKSLTHSFLFDVFVDSVKLKIDYVLYLDPNEIDSYDVGKDSANPNGSIYIKLKKHALLTKFLQGGFLSLTEITKTNLIGAEKDKPILYALDNRLLIDTADVRIPRVCLNRVTIIKASEIPYFKTAFPDALMIMIQTKNLTTRKYPPVIHIRGQAGNQ